MPFTISQYIIKAREKRSLSPFGRGQVGNAFFGKQFAFGQCIKDIPFDICYTRCLRQHGTAFKITVKTAVVQVDTAYRRNTVVTNKHF